MARTYRCKNASRNQKWFWGKHVKYYTNDDGILCEAYCGDIGFPIYKHRFRNFSVEKYLKYLEHDFHGDKDKGVRNAPKDFRKGLNSIVKAKNSMVLKNAFINDEFDDMNFYPNKRNANWLWW